MKKFSKINESINQEIFGWSPNDILKELKKIPGCNVNYKSTQFVFRDDCHEFCDIEDIKRGSIKTSWSEFKLEPDNEYHIQHSFTLDFNDLRGRDKFFLFENGEELEMEDFIPISKLTKIFNDIEECLKPLRSDFFIHLYYEGPLKLHNLSIELDFTSKNLAEKEYIFHNLR
jgi:hypothetical protein